MKLQMFTNLVMVISSQYIQILNCYVVSLKLIYYDMSIIPQSKKKKQQMLQESWGFPSGSEVKESVCNVGDPSLIPDREDPLLTHSHILAWRIPWTEKSDGL